jgi:aminopeptidase N
MIRLFIRSAALLAVSIGVFNHSALAQHPCATARIQYSAMSPIASAGMTRLESQYDVHFHHLDLHVESTSSSMSGSVRTVATSLFSTLDTFGFELYSTLVIDSVIQAGFPLVVIRAGNEASAVLHTPVAAGNDVDLTIYYHGTPPSAGSNPLNGAGFNSSTDTRWNEPVTYTLSQPYAAFEWWPCKQALTDKIDSSWCFITTDSTNKAGSNGILTNIVPVGGSKVRYEWKSHHPISYYLISLAVAHYREYRTYAHPMGYPDSIPIINYIYDQTSTFNTYKTELNKMASLVELFSKLYGLYPFADEKYGHCMSDINGGMEHQTMTTLNAFSFDIDAHELGHQWFGDNVTCGTWSDIYVNEGLASYSEYLANQFLVSKAVANSKMTKIHNTVMSRAGGSIWFTDTSSVARIFSSRLSYDKGAAVTHTLRYVMGNDSLFFLGLQTYQQQNKNGNGTIQSFKQAFESVSGLNLDTFFAQWVYGEGFPTYSASYNMSQGEWICRINQSVSMPSVTPLFTTPLQIRVTRVGLLDTTFSVVLHSLSDTFVIPMLGTTINQVYIDPDNWMINQLGSIVADPNLHLVSGVSVELSANSKWYLYPNPASSVIQVAGYDKQSRVVLFDYTGREIMAPVGSRGEIDIAQWPRGMYIVRIGNPETGQSTSLKLIKE